jgi:hypothetical protein
MSKAEKSELNQNPPWNLDPVSHAGPELTHKTSAALELYGFLRSNGCRPWSAFFITVEEFRHAMADKNPQGGDMCGRFDIADQLTGAAYLPKGDRTPEEMIVIARAARPFMSSYDREYEQQALDKLEK